MLQNESYKNSINKNKIVLKFCSVYFDSIKQFQQSQSGSIFKTLTGNLDATDSIIMIALAKAKNTNSKI